MKAFVLVFAWWFLFIDNPGVLVGPFPDRRVCEETRQWIKNHKYRGKDEIMNSYLTPCWEAPPR